jgi:predicted component of type VI protein secretion system
MNVILTMITPQAWAGRSVPVGHCPFVIGREPSCQLRANTPAVAGRHCVLLDRGDRLFVRDLASGRSTFVNGRPVEGEQELHDQDRVQVGRLAFTVRLACAAAPPRAAPAPLTEAEQAAAEMLLALDTTEAPGATAVGLAAETLPAEGEPPGGAPPEPDRATQPARLALGDTSAAAAQLLARFMKSRASGRGKARTTDREAP